jgi:hypothetical protein
MEDEVLPTATFFFPQALSLEGTYKQTNTPAKD